MTRPVFFSVAAAAVVVVLGALAERAPAQQVRPGFAAPAQAAAPTGGATPSRYAPAGGAAQQVAPVYGPAEPRQTAPAGATGGGYAPVRQVAGEEPIRQPLGGQSGVAPLGAPVAGPSPAPATVANPQTPEGFPLQPQVEQWVDQVLMFWEQRSTQVKTFKCRFQRWDYDPVFGPKDTFKTYASGVIQYAAPDKGLYRVESLQAYVPPKAEGEKPQYAPQGPENGEHWISNGESIFEFDSRNKRVVERMLPPDMKGRAIVDGPLPFLFGARAQTIKARYWIRPSAFKPAEVKGEFWLEAYPKARQDAQNFKMVLVVLDEKDFLPLRMQIFAPNFDPQRNNSRTVYQFDNREVNAQKDLVGNLAALFTREFYNPKTPTGWKTIKEGLGGLAPGQVQAAPGAAPGPQAQAPVAPLR